MEVFLQYKYLINRLLLLYKAADEAASWSGGDEIPLRYACAISMPSRGVLAEITAHGLRPFGPF